MKKLSFVIIVLCISLFAMGQGRVTRPINQNVAAQREQSHHATNKIKPSKGMDNGHEWVDLGLPSGTKWATCNVGANNPWDYGSYFSWGEVTPETKDSYKDSNRYKSVMAFQGNAKYDVAKYQWGGDWSTPTKQNIIEILNNCHIQWSEINGYIGVSIKGPNGNSIFLPAAGMKCETKYHWEPDKYGAYWSATPDEKLEDMPYMFLFTKFGSAAGIRLHNCGLGFATPIRPVHK